jgi:DNA-nicking Smr family endonuclease
MTSEKKKADDLEVFRKAMADVSPLAHQNRAPPHMRRPAALALQRERDEQAVLSELLLPHDDPAELETGEELLYLRPGYQARLLRRLRRGQYSVAATVDLHHMDKVTARQVLLDFLEHSLGRGHGCVRIIHGKGLRSRSEPILKILTRRLLTRHPSVIAFASCRPVDGGTGAVNVLLKVGGRPRT